ncbi:hypothetical protein LOK49_LG11G00123 [Camellia lanceoleosa]|uniref:Uncharacterized protein n=1 Tax=Camellia lanceoleosa TaxID=1840588 RepID=A0ACC0FZD7_9ERIC|nr:hypothetical protein LOK49_LG11G00123 [Camellia lanceoleosa]
MAKQSGHSHWTRVYILSTEQRHVGTGEMYHGLYTHHVLHSIGYLESEIYSGSTSSPSKRRWLPIHSLRRSPATATQGVPISKHLVLSLVASLRLPFGEKLGRIFGCPCISANSKQLLRTSCDD